MPISSTRYFRDRQRDDLALRMIGLEARTCTIKSCTALTDDRIRRLYRTFADHYATVQVRRRRGKSPRQVAFFTRNAQVQFESSLLAGLFTVFGLTRQTGDPAHEPSSIEFGETFCDAYETYVQLRSGIAVSFEHAWFLLQLLHRHRELKLTHCRRCQSQYLRDHFNLTTHSCPLCALKGEHRQPTSRLPTPSRRRLAAGHRAESCATKLPVIASC